MGNHLPSRREYKNIDLQLAFFLGGTAQAHNRRSRPNMEGRSDSMRGDVAASGI